MIRWICHLLFIARGWSYVNRLPSDLRSFVLVGAPHTSNWDFVPAMTIAFRSKLNARFVIKKEWLRFPMNLFLTPIGALGVDRDKIKSGQIKSSTDFMAHLFQEHDPLVLMIAPEGTRSPNQEWKSGFWHIAHKAQVPIVLAYADYSKKEAGMGKVIIPQDLEKDMRAIMDFYKTVTGCHPEKFLLDQRYK